MHDILIWIGPGLVISSYPGFRVHKKHLQLGNSHCCCKMKLVKNRLTKVVLLHELESAVEYDEVYCLGTRICNAKECYQKVLVLST